MKITNLEKKNFLWNLIGTSFNAFISLIFMIIVTRINGSFDAGIFAIAFSTACILYFLGQYSGRIFQVSDTTKTNDKDYIINRVISVVLMIFCLGCFILFKKYDLYKALIFLQLGLYKACEAFSDVIYGILQKNNKLYLVGQSYFIKALVGVIGFFVIDFFTKNLILSCAFLVIENIFFLLTYDLYNVRKVINKDRADKKRVLKIFISGVFIFLLSFLSSYIVNAPKYAIDGTLSEELQAIFGIIVMPATVVALFSQFIIHPYLNNLIDLNKKNKIKEIKKIMTKLILLIIGFGAFCIVFGYITGVPLFKIVYGLDLEKYKINLVIILIAATFNVITAVESAILTTLRYTFSQFLIYAIVSIFAFFISIYLTEKYGLNGATVAYLLIMTLQSILYFITTMVTLRKKEKSISKFT